MENLNELSKKYTLRYRVLVESGVFDESEAHSHMNGVCDALMFVGLVENNLGGEEIFFWGLDGRNAHNNVVLTYNQVFKFFLALAAEIKEGTGPEWQKEIAEVALECFLGMNKKKV